MLDEDDFAKRRDLWPTQSDDAAREFRRRVFYAAITGFCMARGAVKGSIIKDDEIVSDALAVARAALNGAMVLIK